MIVPLTAYFDASGCEPDREVFSVGGWIAEVDQWKQFCRAWQPILDRAPFAESIAAEDRIFHAADLESLKGIYRGWTKEQQQAFQGEAYQIIQDLQPFRIATAVVKSDYEKLQVRFSQFKQGHEGNYYLHSLHDVLKNVQNWLDSQRFETSVQYIFEAGTIGEFHIEQTLLRILNDPQQRKMFRTRGYSMLKKDTLPLQAADIWAYESYKQMVNRIVPETPSRDVRYPYRRLYSNRHREYQTYWDGENLAELIRIYNQLEKDNQKEGPGSS